MTDEVLDKRLTSKLPVVHQRTNGNLPKVPVVYCGDACGDLEPSKYNIKEMNRARTEQRNVNNFSLHAYFMYFNQLEHKKRHNGNYLAEEGNCGISVPGTV